MESNSPEAPVDGVTEYSVRLFESGKRVVQQSGCQLRSIHSDQKSGLPNIHERRRQSLVQTPTPIARRPRSPRGTNPQRLRRERRLCGERDSL
jgi:hypothetical protein